VASDDDYRAGKGGDCIKIGVEHGGDVRNEDITEHATTDASQHAEQRSHHRVKAVAQRRLCAGYGKERQTRRIEGQNETT
jgi:hypothetical protein